MFVEPTEGHGNWDRIFKHSFELKKAQKKAHTLEGELKKTKEALNAEMKAREASNDLASKPLIQVDATQDKMSKALQDLTELQQVA